MKERAGLRCWIEGGLLSDRFGEEWERGSQMWSPLGLDVKAYVEPPLRPRSGVVAHRPPCGLWAIYLK